MEVLILLFALSDTKVEWNSKYGYDINHVNKNIKFVYFLKNHGSY
ncbi:hypothetical protein J2W95_000719 [Flavobacterium granuli]|uniref:Uncharacterized protein n=1 Tax=Flavobacterium granuli TaxID=280093 RepID=A0ABU1S1M6_9FLAO|nr:hypothetical protein [Flavobacterium granuli]